LQTTILITLVVIAFIGLVALARAVRIVQQYERGVVFRLGRVRDGTRGPGLTLIVPVVDRLAKVNLQITTMSVPAQDGITRDNVSVRVDAVVYFRVVDPVKALVNVQNYMYAVSQVAQTSLRAVIGRARPPSTAASSSNRPKASSPNAATSTWSPRSPCCGTRPAPPTAACPTSPTPSSTGQKPFSRYSGRTSRPRNTNRVDRRPRNPAGERDASHRGR
jgi:hypothetical protein